MKIPRYEVIDPQKSKQKPNEAVKNIVLFFNSHKKLEEYVTGVAKVTINTKTNGIIKMALGRSISDNKSLADAIIQTATLEKFLNERGGGISAIISSVSSFKQRNNSIMVNPYSISKQRQNDMVNLYINNWKKITIARTPDGLNNNGKKINIQPIKIGSGIIINESGDMPTLALDYAEITPITMAIMFVLEYINNNKVDMLINDLTSHKE